LNPLPSLLLEDPPTPLALAGLVKRRSLQAGFDEARIASATAPPVLAHFRRWIEQGHAGVMDYLVEQVDKRSDVTVAFPWARSVIVSALQYDTPHPYSTNAPPTSAWIARYAWGDDY